MRKCILVLVSAFLLVTPIDASAAILKKDSKVASLKKKKITNKPYRVKKIEKEVARLVNLERKKHKLKPLKIDNRVGAMARKKSQDMKSNEYFSHQSPTYGLPSDMLKKFNIPFKAAGENIAKGSLSAKDVMKRWMKSPGHKANILSPMYTHIGVGFIKGGARGSWWTQVFISRAVGVRHV